MITPIELALKKLADVIIDSGINKMLDSFQENNILDPRIISFKKEAEKQACEQDVKKILKNKRTAATLQDFIKKSFELADGEFNKRMAALNSPSFAPRSLMVGDGVSKKRKKYRKKANKG